MNDIMDQARRAIGLAIIVVLGVFPANLSGEVVRSGYFRGVDLRSMMGADVAIAESDPAVALILSAEAQEAEILNQFDQWYAETRPQALAAYVVVVGTQQLPQLVLEEAFQQRGLRAPVLFTERNLLGGRPFRLLVLRGAEATELERFDPAEISRHLPDVIAETRTRVEERTTVEEDTEAAAVDTVTTVVERADTGPRSGTYNNTRYLYSVEFPEDWMYREALNRDGAVGRAPRGSELDFRVWAVPNNTGPDGAPGVMDMPEYLKRHLAFIAEDTGSRVRIENRFVIQDQDHEGRDYTYSYIDPERDDAEIRGRIQVFEVAGVFKVANVEGPAREFDRAEEMIEEFMLSFDPDVR